MTESSACPEQSPGQPGGEGPACKQVGDKVILLTTEWGFQRARGKVRGLERVRKGKRTGDVRRPGDLSSIPEGLFYWPVEAVEVVNPNADQRDKSG